MAGSNSNRFPGLYIWKSIKYLLVSLVYYVIMFLIVYVVVGVFLGIQTLDFKYIVIAAVAVTFAASLFASFFSTIRNTELNAMGSVWTTKKRKWYVAHLQLLPYLIFIAAVLIFCYVNLDSIKAIAEEEFMGGLFLVSFALHFPMYTLFRWLQLINFCIKGTCKGCGAIFSWVQATTATYNTRNYVDVKTGSSTEYIGTVENSAGKIDVYGRVPTVQARQNSTTTTSYECQCAFCGRYKHIFDSNTHIGQWKKY